MHGPVICSGAARLIKFQVCRASALEVRVGRAERGNLQNERVTAQQS